MSRIAILVAAVAAVVAACASADATDTTDAPTTTAAITTTTLSVAASDEFVTLVLTGTDEGDALATGDGRTVYLFTRDEPGTTTCFDGCLATWPPVPAVVQLGDGLDAGLIGSIERPDGTIQATYAGWPLYFYSGDQPGDTNGQGFGGVWYLVGADGSSIGQARGGYGY